MADPRAYETRPEMAAADAADPVDTEDADRSLLWWMFNPNFVRGVLMRMAEAAEPGRMETYVLVPYPDGFHDSCRGAIEKLAKTKICAESEARAILTLYDNSLEIYDVYERIGEHLFYQLEDHGISKAAMREHFENGGKLPEKAEAEIFELARIYCEDDCENPIGLVPLRERRTLPRPSAAPLRTTWTPRDE